MEQYYPIALFFALQFINVIFSTVRSILTVQGSRTAAVTISVISYTFGAVVTKLLTQQSFEVVVIATAVTNAVGVYVGKVITDRLRPESLRLQVATVRDAMVKEFEQALRDSGVRYTALAAMNDRNLFVIYAYTKDDSRAVDQLISSYDVCCSVIPTLSSK